MRLLIVEVRRLLARRFFRIGILVTFLGIAAVVGLQAKDSHRPTEAEWAQARAFAAAELVDVKAERAACYRAKAAGNEEPGRFPADCAQLADPRPENFLSSPPFVFTEHSGTTAAGITILATLAAFIVGATAVGAEWNHGTLGALLLWEPRRMRVFLAKLTAVLLTMLAAGAVAFAEGIGGAWIVAQVFGAIGTPDASFARELLFTCLRGLALAGAAAVFGFAIAITAKRTAAALGVLLGYIAFAEIGVRWFADESERWLVSTQIIAWLNKHYSYYVSSCTITDGCSAGEHTVGLGQGGSYLAILTLAAVVAAALIFRRREVT